MGNVLGFGHSLGYFPSRTFPWEFPSPDIPGSDYLNVKKLTNDINLGLELGLGL